MRADLISDLRSGYDNLSYEDYPRELARMMSLCEESAQALEDMQKLNEGLCKALQCVNDEIAFIVEEDGTISKPTKDDGYTAEDKKVEVVAPEKTDTDLGLEIWADKYGKNEARKKALGSRYNAAQAEAERLNKLHISEYMKELKAYEKKHGALFK